MAISLDETIREAFGRLVYTHKAHEKNADLILEGHIKWSIAEVVLIALTSGGTVSTLLDICPYSREITAILSISALCLTLYLFRSQPEQKAQQHRATARLLWEIREAYIALISDLHDKTISDDHARKRRDSLTERTSSIYKLAPDISPKAYEKAREALQIKEDFSFNQGEIDSFLPASLKRNPNGTSQSP